MTFELHSMERSLALKDIEKYKSVGFVIKKEIREESLQNPKDWAVYVIEETTVQIEINSLDDLLALSEKLGKDIIVNSYSLTIHNGDF